MQFQIFVCSKKLRTEIWLGVVYYREFILKLICLANTPFNMGTDPPLRYANMFTPNLLIRTWFSENLPDTLFNYE